MASVRARPSFAVNLASLFRHSPLFAVIRLMWPLKRGISFLWNPGAIVFFAPYPYPERQSDGYFQRIQMVDRLFADRWRIYIESDEPSLTKHWFDRPEPQVVVLRILRRAPLRWCLKALALLMVLPSRKVYIHSVYCMQGQGIRMLMHMPGIRKVVDIHGAVPEEFRIQSDERNALRFEALERLAVQKGDLVVVVSQAMKSHLYEKHGGVLKVPMAILPMFLDRVHTLDPRPYPDGKSIVIYAGGLQKWQQVDKMIDAISRSVSICAHRFYCPDPDSIRKMLPEAVRSCVIIDHKTHAELSEVYRKCHYGFLLREDIVVNRVACPTKLVEYLAMGVVPIVDSEAIGDFKVLGMRFVTLAQLLGGDLPNEVERTKMVEDNFIVYDHLTEICKQGEQDICAMLADEEA